MAQNTIQELNELGQSIWLDNISKTLIKTGRLKQMIGLGLRGITSNPTIFEKAVNSSSDYDEEILELSNKGKSDFEIYDDLTVKDIQDAADIFLPVYKETNALDGYISLEVSPKLAHKTQETIEEARRLFKKVNRPNLMLKVPCTDESFKAIEVLIAYGININVTLIFSLKQYIKSANAYLKGIRHFLENKGNPGKIRSVASVFVSRVDTLCDKILDEKIQRESDSAKKDRLISLKGKAAVANSRLIYAKYREIFNSDESKHLCSKAVNLQRVLWGSTSTKNPAYSDIKYVSELIGKYTVNTVPDNTFEALLDHGKAEESLSSDISEAKKVIAELGGFKVDIDAICAQLLKDGVAAFEKSFDSLLNTIEQKRMALCKR